MTIKASDSSATEANHTTGAFTVTRTGVITAALTVNYTVGGSATSGSDYVALSTSVIIPVGSKTAVITVSPIDDSLIEADETVIVTTQPQSPPTSSGLPTRPPSPSPTTTARP